MRRVSGVPEQQRRHAVGIVAVHRQLAQDDLLLFLVFVLGQRRVHDRVGHHINGRIEAAGAAGMAAVHGNIHLKHCSFEAGEGVHVAALVGDLSRDAADAAFLGALEQHVLEDVREARAHLRAFVNAAGFHPHLDTGHRRAVVLAQQHHHSIVEHGAAHRSAAERAQVERGFFCVGSHGEKQAEKKGNGFHG